MEAQSTGSGVRFLWPVHGEDRAAWRLSETSDTRELLTHDLNTHSDILLNGRKGATTQMSVRRRWVNKMCCGHTVEYYWAVERTKVLRRVTP